MLSARMIGLQSRPVPETSCEVHGNRLYIDRDVVYLGCDDCDNYFYIEMITSVCVN